MTVLKNRKLQQRKLLLTPLLLPVSSDSAPAATPAAPTYVGPSASRVNSRSAGRARSFPRVGDCSGEEEESRRAKSSPLLQRIATAAPPLTSSAEARFLTVNSDGGRWCRQPLQRERRRSAEKAARRERPRVSAEEARRSAATAIRKHHQRQEVLRLCGYGYPICGDDVREHAGSRKWANESQMLASFTQECCMTGPSTTAVAAVAVTHAVHGAGSREESSQYVRSALTPSPPLHPTNAAAGESLLRQVPLPLSVLSLAEYQAATFGVEATTANAMGGPCSSTSASSKSSCLAPSGHSSPNGFSVSCVCAAEDRSLEFSSPFALANAHETGR